MRTMALAVVVPVFKEEWNIPEYLRRIVPIPEQTTKDFEIVFSLDPSPDRTQEAILEHRAKDPRGKLLTFSRRVGERMASLAGLQYSLDDAVI